MSDCAAASGNRDTRCSPKDGVAAVAAHELGEGVGLLPSLKHAAGATWLCCVGPAERSRAARLQIRVGNADLGHDRISGRLHRRPSSSPSFVRAGTTTRAPVSAGERRVECQPGGRGISAINRTSPSVLRPRHCKNQSEISIGPFDAHEETCLTNRASRATCHATRKSPVLTATDSWPAVSTSLARSPDSQEEMQEEILWSNLITA